MKLTLVLCSVVLFLSLSQVFSATTGTTKEHKKKLIEKLRAALNSNESEAPAASIPTVEELEKAAETLEVEKEQSPSIVVQDEIPAPDSNNKVSEDTSSQGNKVDPSGLVSNVYMTKFRNVFKRVLEVLGLRRRKDGRQSRLLQIDNDLDRVPQYKDEVKTTVGAILGQKECVEKVACVSGSLLKGIKGKQLIFALLDVFSPTSWKETVKIAKQSAIFNESCSYKCLED